MGPFRKMRCVLHLVVSLASGLTPVRGLADTCALVTTTNGGELLIVDPSSYAVGARIRVGNYAWSLAVDTARAYVGYSTEHETGVRIIDLEALSVTSTIKLGDRSGLIPDMVVGPGGETLYLPMTVCDVRACTGAIGIVDIEERSVVGTIGVPGQPNGIAVTPDGTALYVTSSTSSHVSVIDLGSHALVDEILIEDNRSYSVAMVETSLRGPFRALPRAYVSNGRTLTVIDIDSRLIVSTVRVGDGLFNSPPRGVAGVGGDHPIFVAAQLCGEGEGGTCNGRLAAVDSQDNQLSLLVRAGFSESNEPRAVAIQSNRVWVTHGYGVTVFDEGTLNPVADISLHGGPDVIDFATLSRRCPVACPGDCDGNRRVTVDELLQAVNVSLEHSQRSIWDCLSADTNVDYRLSVEELVASVDASMRGCSP